MTPFITSIISIVGSLTAFLLAFYISSQGLKNKVRSSYVLAALAAALWLLIYTFWLWQTDEKIAFLFIRVVMVFAIFTYPTLLHFVLRFLNYKRDIVIYFAYISAVILALFCLFTDLFVSGVTQKLLYPFWGIRGSFVFDIYVLMWILVIVFSLTLLLDSYRKEKNSFKKAQVRFVLLGLALGYIGGASNFFLWYDIPIPPYGNIVIPLYFSLIAYAIIRYRFADIRLIIKRSAIFAILVVIITSVYALLAFLISEFFQDIIGTQSIILNGIITAVLVSFGFEPLKKTLSEVTDQYFFKAEYNPQEVLAEFADKLSRILDLEELTKFIAKRLHLIFKSEFVSLFLLNEKSNQYERVTITGKPKKHLKTIDHSLFNEINKYLVQIERERDIFVRDEIKKFNEELQNPILELFHKELDKHGVSLLVPLYVQEELIGLLFLGDKKSGDIYTQDDIKILEIIESQVSVAVQNSKLYEEQRQFAKTLKMEVDKATKELKVANVQLKKLDKAKSEFISIASHQLRTPLTVIKGYVSMINQGDFGKVPTPVQNPLDKVFKSTLRIITLVEDLLNISRIESGRMKYELEKVDLVALVKEVCEELVLNAQKKGLDLLCEIGKDKIPEIIMDRKKMREVVMNLIDNAIKYTEKGSVKVILKRKNKEVFYCVEDTGRGIEPDQMPLLFQKFSRTKGAQLVHTEGTGLGLYIAKQIVAKHGGKIWAESDGRNKGSKFCISFKLKNSKLAQEMRKQSKKV